MAENSVPDHLFGNHGIPSFRRCRTPAIVNVLDVPPVLAVRDKRVAEDMEGSVAIQLYA